jgi:hypothetical protein
VAEVRKYEVWVCSACGQQVTTGPEYDQRRCEYVRGHYHDRPAAREGEDPWFDAVLVTAIDQRDVEPLVEAAKRLLEVADGSAEIKPTKGVSAGRLWVEARSRALIATRDALAPFLEEGERHA